MNTDEYWKTKLLAYLHDPPCKALDIKTHEDRARSFRSSAGIDDELYKKFERQGDWLASSADRFPFPSYRKTKLKADFDGGESNPFRHPFGGDNLTFSTPLASATLAEDFFTQSINVVPADSEWSPFAKFMLYWRRWPEESARKDERLAYLPADTRIPDHTIWNHMGLTSAFQSCVNTQGELKPAFLMFSLGPVQEFISAARSTRDFFSGSYLLSWLAACGLKTVAEELGPDHVIFPNLRGQPLFDSMFRETVYEKIELNNNETLWDRMSYTDKQLLTPTLPNVFLAVVPEERAEEIGKMVENSIRVEWKEISRQSWEGFEKIVKKFGLNTESDWEKRWEKQVDLFLNVFWQVFPWDESLPDDENLKSLRKLAENLDSISSNPAMAKGFTWPSQYREAARLMAARKSLRNFEPFITDEYQEGSPKDVLSGKEEIIGSEELWKYLKDTGDEEDDNEGDVFKKNEGPYGALSIIKRLWIRDDYVPYLHRRLQLSSLNMNVPSIPAIAAKNDDKSPYVAILSLDGDEMGKWISGEKLPSFVKQLAPSVSNWLIENDYLKPEYFSDKTLRSLSPSYHLQFSEALSNFSNHIVRDVVESYGGYLIYTGGDDVLAILPADKALSCAYFLRTCFRGESPELFRKSFKAAQDGSGGTLSRIRNYRKLKGWMVHEGWGDEQYPLLMPGPFADVSCGIAIAHEKYPLTSLIKEAHSAEKRAKNLYGRGAFAVSLLKRGGETIHWGAKWQSGDFIPLELFNVFLESRKDSNGEAPVSGRFTSALAELLQPYRLDKNEYVENLDMVELIMMELNHVLGQQMNPSHPEVQDYRNKIETLSKKYLDVLKNGYGSGDTGAESSQLGDFMNLFRTAAFIQRERD